MREPGVKYQSKTTGAHEAMRVSAKPTLGLERVINKTPGNNVGKQKSALMIGPGPTTKLNNKMYEPENSGNGNIKPRIFNMRQSVR
jgi:hypothetical protein